MNEEHRMQKAEFIEAALKADPYLKLISSKTERRLHWASDTQQWEVYSFDRYPTWHYKGTDVEQAIAALESKES